MVAIDELGAIVGFCAKQRKQIDRFAYQIAFKRSPLSGVILVVASQFASADTIPNAVALRQLSTIKIFLGSAPAELVRMVFPTSISGLSLLPRQFEGFVYVDGQS